MIKFTKDDTQECSDNHVLSINLLSFSTTILTIYDNDMTNYDNDNSDDLCQRSIFSSTRIYKTKLEYILILTYKYLGLIIICIPITYSYMMSLSYISEIKNKILSAIVLMLYYNLFQSNFNLSTVLRHYTRNLKTRSSIITKIPMKYS